MVEKNVNTKQLIRETLFSLSSQMNKEKINIATIIKACGISRTLFYYYYSDMFDLLKDILSTNMEKVMQDCLKIEDGYKSCQYYIMCCTGYFPLM